MRINFHGDIPTTNVEVITKKWLLRNNGNSGVRQSINKFLLKNANKPLMSQCPLMKHFGSVCKAAFRFISGKCQTLALLWRSLLHPNVHRFRTVSGRDIGVTQDTVNNLTAKSETLGKVLDGFSGEIAVDKVVSVKIIPSGQTATHVYNLQTENGYYFVNSSIAQSKSKCNGIFAIAKNCRCTLIAAVDGVDTSNAKRRVRNPETGKNELVSDMTYSEWSGLKEKAQVQKAMEEKQVEKTQISTREQAYKALTDDIGFGSVSDNVSVIDEKLLTENVTQLKKLNERFGALTTENNGYFTATSAPRAVAYSQGNFRNLNHQSMSLCGNSYGRGYDFLVSKEKDFVSTNWSMPCLDKNLPIYTVTHEYGHIFENKVIRSRVDMDVFEKAYNAKMLEKNGAKKAMDFLKKEEAKQAKTIWQEITQIAKEENPDFLVSKNISEYGKTNYFEAFAETFANSQCGSPNELGKAMNIWLERNGY